MPSTPTVLAGVSRDATYSATWVSASASVTSGRLVLVPFGCGWGAGPTSLSSITSTFAIQGSWTVVVESDPYGSRECIAGWAWAIADETASGTVTTTWANSFGQIKWGAVLEIASDFDSTTPARAQTNDSNGAATLASDTDLTGTLGSAPLSSSVVLMSLFGREGIGASTFISGFTSLSASAGDNAAYGTAYAAGSNGAGYGGQFSVAMGAGAVVSAIEIQEPSGGGQEATGGGDFGVSLSATLSGTGAVAAPGIVSDAIKEPNESDQNVANSSVVTVRVWHGATITGAPDEVLSNQSITDGVLTFEPGVLVGDPVSYQARWEVGDPAEDRFFEVLNDTAADLNE